MRRSSYHSGNSLKIAFIFICCILLLIAGGFLLKLFLVLRASTFDGVHQYILEIDENREHGALVAFSPATSSITMLQINGRVDNTFGKYLGIPVDGVVSMSVPENPSELAGDVFIKSSHEKGITIIDKLRLLLFANSLKQDNFHKKTIQLPIDTATSDTVLPSLFQDTRLYNDNESIAIINATGESGVGSEIAHQLGIIGMNVLSVTTASDEQNATTIIAMHTDTYTVQKIERLFHVDARSTATTGISDIVLTIGKESLPALQ
ncbi:MAG TPA: LytR C-terminal domain-containing protein [Patescibacteria group bacterium]|nr:LytR C-terminal domain-containing protein [Patescibacteria group bacterium]